MASKASPRREVITGLTRDENGDAGFRDY
jgi:hypothetical protein